MANDNPSDSNTIQQNLLAEAVLAVAKTVRTMDKKLNAIGELLAMLLNKDDILKLLDKNGVNVPPELRNGNGAGPSASVADNTIGFV